MSSCVCLPGFGATYSYIGTESTFTVMTTGTYFILGDGASGGSAGTGGAGLGAEVSGYFSLTAGEVLDIFVGQEGASVPSSYGAGGGGGTFIAIDSGGTPGPCSSRRVGAAARPGAVSSRA